ncbi:MAG: PA14 domain-containing protein, partial [Planctomycetota bacterium]
MRRLILWVSTVCLALSTVSSGEVKREIWNGAVSSPYMENAIARVNSGTPADQVDILDEPTWADIADNYVARMTGWLTVPETGEYTLYLSGDDYQRLWVSQDDNPGNAEVVAYVDGWTQSQEWGKYESQKAEPMMLTEGQVMAFVGIMEERGGGDGQDWGWIAPGSEEITVIPGELFVAEHEVTALGKAKMNAPAEGATGIIDAVLSWGLAVEDAEPPAYNLYFGTDPDALDLIGEGIVEESVDVGTAGAELEYATTYYWQVERIGAAVDPARSFTTEPFSFPIEGVAATTNGTSGPDVGTIEQTIDGSGLDENDGHSTESMDMWLAVPPEGEALTVEYAFDRVYKMDKMLIWNSNTGFESFLGYGVKDATIEYTLDGAEWMALADVEVARAPGLESNPADTTVDFGGVGAAAVRLTLKTNWGGLFPDTGLSEVRFMYIPGQARFPMPANGAEGVGPDAVLSWQTGRDAVSHDVLIGVDELALAGTVEDTSFAPELVYGMPYIWAVNENDGVDVWEGDLWSFSTTEFATVVGAQSLEYDNTAEPFLSEVETVLDPPV